MASGLAARSPNAIWGADATHVWAVGAIGTIIAFDGTAWTAEPKVTLTGLSDVAGLGPAQVYVVGPGTTILRFGS